LSVSEHTLALKWWITDSWKCSVKDLAGMAVVIKKNSAPYLLLRQPRRSPRLKLT